MSRSVAVIMAVHNRREATLRSVGAILAQGRAGLVIELFVTDDGSTDGTAAALQGIERVRVIEGDGSLYWAAGMALAERAAMLTKPDFLLWLNDDTYVDPDALGRLLVVSDSMPDSIVVGATRDPEMGSPTYGGRRRVSWWHPQRFERLPVGDAIQSADTFNGNLVLVPASVRERVGPIDDRFPHAYADDDYGLRAGHLGIRVVQAPGSLAECAVNSEARGQPDGRRGWRRSQHRKALPWRAQVRFFRRHGGPMWPLILLGQQGSWMLRRSPSPR